MGNEQVGLPKNNEPEEGFVHVWSEGEAKDLLLR